IFAAALLVFLVQNREVVSIDFLGFSVRTPLAVMAAIFYALGAATASSAYALLRKSMRQARATCWGDYHTASARSLRLHSFWIPARELDRADQCNDRCENSDARRQGGNVEQDQIGNDQDAKGQRPDSRDDVVGAHELRTAPELGRNLFARI